VNFSKNKNMLISKNKYGKTSGVKPVNIKEKEVIPR